ncbi:hypothetical protein GCM10022224_078700 [Nonomuraea antimicrobica]|uniref:Uncharacterized protein n=1 Tax=Nonomuraea antimicrobica TaxID=561173 RepID=A0ABP7D5B6_9ACTN
MATTRFGPLPAHLVARCAPTEHDEETGHHLKGTVHDFSARLLNGVCGIAGAFSTLGDLATFLRYLLKPSPVADQPGLGSAWTQAGRPGTRGGLSPPIVSSLALISAHEMMMCQTAGLVPADNYVRPGHAPMRASRGVRESLPGAIRSPFLNGGPALTPK